MSEHKFDFDIDFQTEMLGFICSDKKNGYKLLDLVEPEYFELIEHTLICYAIKNYHKRNKRIPSKNILIERLKRLFSKKEIKAQIRDDNKARIIKIIPELYKQSYEDPEGIMAEVINFSKFVSVNNVVEQFDLTDYKNYDSLLEGLREAISKGDTKLDTSGTFLIKDAKDRQHERAIKSTVVPTPIRQLNRVMNAGGLEKNSVVTIIGPEKSFKTGVLVNIIRLHLANRKKVIVFDFENGEKAYHTRVEQSLLKKSKDEILSNKHDNKLNEILRRYNRLGGEVYIKRMNALSNINDCQNVIDNLYRNYGMVFNVAVFDYVALMDSLEPNRGNEFKRISDAYIDVKNFTNNNDLDVTYTANHVTRPAANERFATIFEPGDIAKCIDIPRHVDMLMGMQQSEAEAEAGVMRLSIIEQRDGITGQALFWYKPEWQRLDEFSKTDETEWYRQMKAAREEQKKKEKPDFKGKRDL